MELILVVLSIMLVVSFKLNFEKKLVALMMLEGLMILTIFFFFYSFSSSPCSIYSLVILSIFMVMDSVLGVSILICSSRASSRLSIWSSFYSDSLWERSIEAAKEMEY